MVIIGTANNISLSGELAKRAVPIVLQPKDGRPELRTDFVHPDIIAHVRTVRVHLQRILLGMVQSWIEAGQPAPSGTMGGYEAWYRAVGGVMRHCGFRDWLTNRTRWTKRADPEFADPHITLDALWEHFGSREFTAAKAVKVAEAEGICPQVLERPPTGRNAAMGHYLRSLQNRPCNGLILRVRTSGNNPFYSVHETEVDGG
jgi:hypothetical protein